MEGIESQSENKTTPYKMLEWAAGARKRAEREEGGEDKKSGATKKNQKAGPRAWEKEEGTGKWPGNGRRGKGGEHE